MPSCLSLAVAIQNQPNGSLSRLLIVPIGLWFGGIFPVTDFTFEELTTGSGPAIFDLLFISLTVWTLNHIPVIPYLLD
jgi:hypothetical protein